MRSGAADPAGPAGLDGPGGPAGSVAGRVQNAVSRVSTLELLFDLVFVFTITQVTEVVIEHPNWLGVAQAALILAIVWWMYDGYAWVTNQVTNQARNSALVLRFGLIAAMIAFLLLAISIPRAFGDAGLLFGIAYLVIVVIHFTLFQLTGAAGARRGMMRIGPVNVIGALPLVAAGFVTGVADWVLFVLAVVVFVAGGSARGRSFFDIGAAHFVERHGLLMIIAFGESIVSVGVGASDHAIDASLIVGAALCVGVVAAMWWCYFSGDDARAGELLTGAAMRRRSSLALTAFGVDHLVMIMGLVVFAAGVRLSISDVFAVVGAPAAWLLAGGVALYLLGDARYRQELSIGPAAWRYTGAVVAVATAGIGLALVVAFQLAALLIVVAAVIAVEALRRK